MDEDRDAPAAKLESGPLTCAFLASTRGCTKQASPNRPFGQIDTYILGRLALASRRFPTIVSRHGHVAIFALIRDIIFSPALLPFSYVPMPWNFYFLPCFFDCAQLSHLPYFARCVLLTFPVSAFPLYYFTIPSRLPTL